MSVKENILKALEVLERGGRGRVALYSTATGQYCALGALTHATLGVDGVEIQRVSWDSRAAANAYRNTPEVKAVADAINRLHPTFAPEAFATDDPEPFQIVYAFNDDPGFLDEEVFEVFRVAAEVAQ